MGISVQGNVTHGATDYGPPVKIGGKYNSGAVTLADGQRGDAQLDSAGNLKVTVAASGGGVAGTEYTEDAAAAANPAGPMSMARRKDTLSASEVSTDGDNIALNATSRGELYVSAPVGGAYTDRSIANLTGSSETLMPANAMRRILIVHNIGATAIAVNLTGGAASLTAAGSINLAATASLILDHYPPTGAITIIGTLNADVTAYEG